MLSSADNEIGVICPFMKKKLLFGFIFSFLGISLFAQTAGLRIIVEESGGNLTILRSYGSTRELVIPETINDMPVIAIAEGAFTRRGLTMVSIPDSVIEIGEDAFSYNDLRTLVIGDNVETIGRSAFFNNSLNSLTIGSSVNTIGTGAFADNNLTEIVLPDSVIDIEAYAFFNNRLRSLTIPDTVARIGEGAFSSNLLHSVVIGGSVEVIGDGAFYNNRLTNITIPPSINAMGRRVFESRLTRRASAPPVDFFDETGELIFTTADNFDAFFASTGSRPGIYSFSRADGWVFMD
jgi:hypothetical protein